MGALFTARERQAMLGAARMAIESAIAGRGTVEPRAEGVLATRAGAFVSLHRHGALRGCIGHVGDDRALGAVISQCAVAAAMDDPRFDRVSADELRDLDIEISVLGRLARVQDVAEIEVGRHGLIVEQHGHKGLLLPQVATEHRWNRDTFLSQTCRKAGLSPDAWKTGASIFRFEAEVFGEVGDRDPPAAGR